MSIVSPETVVISKDDRNVVTIIAKMHSATLAETLYSSEADITLDGKWHTHGKTVGYA